jgi:hypothetical protein
VKTSAILLSLGIWTVFGQAPSSSSGPLSQTRGGVFARTSTDATAGDHLLSLTPYVELLGTYDTDLVAPVLSSAGQLSQTNSWGGRLSFGVSGIHQWKRTTLGINYDGSYQDYESNQHMNGLNQQLVFAISHTLSPHINLNIVESAGTSVGGMPSGMVGGMVTISSMGSIVDPNAGNIPSGDILDTRTTYASTSADLTVQKTTRLSFDFGGSGFIVRRRAAGMADVTGATARGDIGYRLSRRQTIGAQYNFSHFDYTNVYGGADVHAVGLFHNIAITPRLEVGYTVSGYRFESLQTRTVSLDPVLASLLGVSRTSQVFHSRMYGTSGNAHLSFQQRRGTFVLNYRRQVIPGSGIYLASRQDAVGGGWSYRGLRRVSFGVNARYSTSNALMQSLGKYQIYGGGWNFAVRISSVLHLTTHQGVYNYRINNNSYERTTAIVQAGIGFTPNEIGFPKLF